MFLEEGSRRPRVVAVAALTAPGDERVWFSSCGPQVEVAAPHVSGVAALMFDANPDLTNVQARCILGGTADDLGADGRDRRYGFGRIDAGRAVEAALDLGRGRLRVARRVT